MVTVATLFFKGTALFSKENYLIFKTALFFKETALFSGDDLAILRFSDCFSFCFCFLSEKRCNLLGEKCKIKQFCKCHPLIRNSQMLA